jgi:hypothetical protein
MRDTVQTWHYGVMTRHWAENNTTGPEIAYFQRQIETYGQPALDAGCGTGRFQVFSIFRKTTWQFRRIHV